MVRGVRVVVRGSNLTTETDGTIDNLSVWLTFCILKSKSSGARPVVPSGTVGHATTKGGGWLLHSAIRQSKVA